jgi:hypothetical protein
MENFVRKITKFLLRRRNDWKNRNDWKKFGEKTKKNFKKKLRSSKTTQEEKRNMMKEFRQWMTKYDIRISGGFCEHVRIESSESIDEIVEFFEIIDIERIDEWLTLDKDERGEI